MQYIEVAPVKIIRQNAFSFTYHTKQPISIGTLVRVQVGKQTVVGIVLQRSSKPEYKTKEITDVIEDVPLPEPLIKLALWMSDYYNVHFALVLQAMLPTGVTKKRRLTALNQTVIKRQRTNFVLNTAQAKALRLISPAQQKTILLHGITGSGKTAVYIEAVKKVLAAGKSAIVLTPEISLTPQLLAEFQNHFEHILLTHSQMTEAARHQQWRQALSDDRPWVAIGPRSALFLPLKNIGLIIIDESHEPSYKQEQQPRYTAQRVARILAHEHHASLVLGTATPAVSEYYLAMQSGLIAQLPEKAKADQASRIHIVDATKRHNFSRHQLFSNQLIEAINQQLSAKKQILLFHNRRGSASSALCEHCGWYAACNRCLLPLTLHADIHKLACHICGAHQAVPPHCPMCKHADVIFKGVGTKRIETDAANLFAKARIARFDADAKQDQQLHQQYQAVYDGDIDIIIGTQLLAKGLDLPKLGLVGIVQADTGLLMPDFQARERVFQLISQACGRVGRQAHQTEVVVQTFYPQDSVVQAAIHENYAAFYQTEITNRKRGHYPPFTHLLKLVCAYKTETHAVNASRALAHVLRQNSNVEVIGPTPAFYERLRGLYRWQIIIKSKSRKHLQAIAAQIPQNWHVELDPHSLIS